MIDQEVQYDGPSQTVTNRTAPVIVVFLFPFCILRILFFIDYRTFILSLDKPNTDLQILLSDDAYTTEIPIILHVLAYTVIHAVRVVLKTSIVNVCKLLNKFHVR